jgi:hypothetical protein
VGGTLNTCCDKAKINHSLELSGSEHRFNKVDAFGVAYQSITLVFHRLLQFAVW